MIDVVRYQLNNNFGDLYFKEAKESKIISSSPGIKVTNKDILIWLDTLGTYDLSLKTLDLIKSPLINEATVITISMIIEKARLYSSKSSNDYFLIGNQKQFWPVRTNQINNEWDKIKNIWTQNNSIPGDRYLHLNSGKLIWISDFDIKYFSRK